MNDQLQPGKKDFTRIAVAGCGYWGKNLIRNFHDLGALAAVCDGDEQAAAKYAADYNVSALNWKSILDNTDIKAVVIATPAATHYALARDALHAGKHVFVEKPMALDVAEGEELVRLAEDKERILMVGHLLHYHAAYQKLKALINEGALGDIRYIYSNRLNLGKIRREEDILWSFAPHDISMILDLMGEEPVEVQANGGFYLSDRVADITMMQLRFSGKRKAHIFVSWLHPFKEQKLVVIGEKAMITFNDGLGWDSKLQLYKHRVDITADDIPVAYKAEGQYIPVPESEPLQAECLHFLDAVAGKHLVKTNGFEGVRVLKVLNRAAQSLKNHG